MLVMVVFFIAFRWIHLSTPLIRLFLLVLILLRSEERFSRNAETDLVCRLLLEKKKGTTSERPNPCFACQLRARLAAVCERGGYRAIPPPVVAATRRSYL